MDRDESESFLPRLGKVRKSHPRLEAFGTVDELSCFVGVARSAISDRELDAVLKKIQESLFHLNAYIAVAGQSIDKIRAIRRELEEHEKGMAAQLPVLNRFIYPGGVMGASFLHVCRAVARRAERAVVKLAESESVDSEIISYLNYLSKYFFTAARYVNMKAGGYEDEWISR